MDNYLLRLIPLVVFYLLFREAKKKSKRISIAIISLYLICSICSFFITSDDINHDFSTDNLLYFLIYTLIHALFLKLTFYIDPYININQLPTGKIYNWMQSVLIIGSLYSLIYLLPYAINTMSISALEIRTDMQIEGLVVLPISILTTIAVGFPTFYYIYCFMFFTAIVKKQKLIAYLSLLGLISFVVNVLTVSGRDGFFLSAMALIISYFMFEKIISSTQKRNLKNLFRAFIPFAMIVVIIITVDRFSSTNTLNLLSLKKGVVNYLGMQPFIFSDNLKDINPVFNYGANSFPLFTSAKEVVDKTFYSGQFGTYLTSFYKVSGFSSLILLTLIFYLLFKLTLKKREKFSSISMFFIYGLFCHFMMSGVFYFRMGNSGGNLYILMSIFIFIFLRNQHKFKS